MVNALHVQTSGNNIIIKFTRSEIRNPISVSVLNDLREIVDSISKDQFLRNVILTGTDSVFASGADLRDIGKLTPLQSSYFARSGQDLMNAIAALPQATIAAVNGYCFGGGLDLALACNRRFASPDAIFSHPGVGLGIITGWGGTQRLPRLIGEAAALEMLLTAGRFDAEWALKSGLVDRIVVDPLSEAVSLDQM